MRCTDRAVGLLFPTSCLYKAQWKLSYYYAKLLKNFNIIIYSDLSNAILMVWDRPIDIYSLCGQPVEPQPLVTISITWCHAAFRGCPQDCALPSCRLMLKGPQEEHEINNLCLRFAIALVCFTRSMKKKRQVFKIFMSLSNFEHLI